MILITHSATHTHVEVPGRFMVDVPDGDTLTLNLALTAAQKHHQKDIAARARRYLAGFDIDQRRTG